MNIAINGFGRIGRLAFRNILKRADMNVVAINDLYPVDYLAYMLKYDSSHGRLDLEISHDKEHLYVGGHKIRISSEKAPSKLKWSEVNAEYVIEATGLFLTSDLAQKHLDAGAKKVILSAPSKDETPMFVMGVNHEKYTKEMNIVSNASCTTNCLAPIVEILDRKFGVESGIMSTVHAATATQKTVDSPSLKDWRAGRGAYQNIIPASTGAAKAVGKVLPSMEGKLTGMAYRVPTANVSVVDLTVNLKSETSYAEICRVMHEASKSERYNGILGYTDEDLVSTDFMSDSRTSIFDSKAGIELNSKFFKVVSWYDNEWGYSNKILDLIVHMDTLKLNEKQKTVNFLNG
ncbi:type I glyceraldehyde-3-phosphate dehydrogenase [Flavobacteriales bacterium]|nr:type I glyceraldehyde-3-phosphate dehydrogenase [Flavobacteriales bacterium]MDC1063727.1 type I glyceraldehyde-3-phosphate dehydrogenase [Flavobacteriales bacterium]